MSAPVDGMTADARAAIGELLDLRGQPIVLTPAAGTVVEKPGGGKDYAPGPPRPPQVFAKFATKALGEAENAQTDQGTTRKFIFDLIGAYDAIMAVGDHWEDHAAKYVVDAVDNTQPYQIKATVTAFLKTTGHGFG
jgi:hypothetical protein